MVNYDGSVCFPKRPRSGDSRRKTDMLVKSHECNDKDIS